jgi:thioredoxin
MLFSACKEGARNSENAIAKKDSTHLLLKHGTIHLTKDDFKKLVMDFEQTPEEWIFRGERPCLVDFYADWCAPCRIVSPILEDLAKVYAGRIDIYKIDVDKEREIAIFFGVQSIPSFMYCPLQGKPVFASSIAGSPESTRNMFVGQIEEILLKHHNPDEL